MPNDSLRLRPIAASNRATGCGIDGIVVTGSGPDAVSAIASHARIDSLAVLEAVVGGLLVPKGADWTAAILSEYLQLYEDSLGTFSLVWDDNSRRLVSHGSIFQSLRFPWAALLAHIRTADDFRGLGLGTLVTEEVTGAAFRHGAGIVVLATDDKIHRMGQGETAAHAMYSRIGYAVLGETRLADTIDWLMAVDEQGFAEVQRKKLAGGGRWPDEDTPSIVEAKRKLVDETRARFSAARQTTTEPVAAGDLPSLFVLLNLCPQKDFQLKLTSWQVHHGPETERSFITIVRQAIVDRDRLHDASLVMRDSAGAITAVCAAQQLAPFTRRTYAVDFYCLPTLLAASRDAIKRLIEQTIARIRESSHAPHPCWLSFVGVDTEKIELFASLGFAPSAGTIHFCHPDGKPPLAAKEYTRMIS